MGLLLSLTVSGGNVRPEAQKSPRKAVQPFGVVSGCYRRYLVRLLCACCALGRAGAGLDPDNEKPHHLGGAGVLLFSCCEC